MKPEHSKTIASFAILKSNWDSKGKDYIENFVPFVVNLAFKNSYEQFDLIGLKKDFEKEYGLVIPLAPLTEVLKRAKKRGYFIQRENVYIPVNGKVDDSSFSFASQEQERKLNQVADALRKFVGEKYNFDISVDDAEIYLLKFLRDEDLNIIFNTGLHSELFVDASISESAEARGRFFVAKFLQEISERNQILFGFIKDLVAGQMLAYAILNPNIQNYQGRLKKQNFYLDIAFLFSLLGVDGDDFKEVYQEIVDALKEAGANLFVFKHTFDEFIKILESDLQTLSRENIDFERISRSLSSFILNEYTPSDLMEIINSAEKKLSNAGISLADGPSWKDTTDYNIDESELRSVIVKKYQERAPSFRDDGSKDYTIQKDIDSISAIQRLRKNVRPISLSSSRHTMVTGNSSLAAACNAFVNGGENFSIPPCLHHLFLGTLLFLEMPTRVSKINEKKLIADAYAATQPSDALLRRYFTVIEDLKKKSDITPEDYILLKSNLFARSILQEKTWGQLDQLTNRTPKEILADMHARAKSNAEKKLQEEKNAHRVVQEKLADANYKVDILTEKVQRTNMKIANYASWAFYALIILLFAFLAFRSESRIATVTFASISILCTATGFHFLHAKRKLQNFINKLLDKMFLPWPSRKIGRR